MSVNTDTQHMVPPSYKDSQQTKRRGLTASGWPWESYQWPFAFLEHKQKQCPEDMAKQTRAWLCESSAMGADLTAHAQGGEDEPPDPFPCEVKWQQLPRSCVVACERRPEKADSSIFTHCGVSTVGPASHKACELSL